jgi:hypothetical protein
MGSALIFKKILPQNTQNFTEKICGNLCILWQKLFYFDGFRILIYPEFGRMTSGFFSRKGAKIAMQEPA